MQDAFHIRTAMIDDAKGILEVYGTYVTNTAVTFEYETPSVDDIEALITDTLEAYPFLVATQGENVIGFSYAKAYRTREAYAWSVESSIYISQEQRQNGIGRALYTELENSLRQMGILNMYACIASSDEPDEYLTDASIRFHERMGFTEIGRLPECGCKFGRWYDIVWMGKSLGEHTPDPAKPTRFPSHRV